MIVAALGRCWCTARISRSCDVRAGLRRSSHSRCARGNTSGRSGTGSDNEASLEAKQHLPSIGLRPRRRQTCPRRQPEASCAQSRRPSAEGLGLHTRGPRSFRRPRCDRSCGEIVDAATFLPAARRESDSSTRSCPEAPRPRWGYPDRDRDPRCGLATSSGRSDQPDWIRPAAEVDPVLAVAYAADVTVRMLRDPAATNNTSINTCWPTSSAASRLRTTRRINARIGVP